MNWIPQIIANSDGLGSYLAVTIPAVHTNDALNKEVQEIGKGEFTSNKFWVYEIGKGTAICRAAQSSLIEALKYMGDNRLLIHKGPHFV